MPGVVRRAGPGLPRLGHPAGHQGPGQRRGRGERRAGATSVGDAGRILSINQYGASAAGAKLFEEFGFTAAQGGRRPPRRASQTPKSHTCAPTHPASSRTARARSTSTATPAAPSADPQLTPIPFPIEEELIMSERLKALADAGVSIWLDDLSRDRINSGNLADLVADSSRHRRDHQPDDLRRRAGQGRRLRRADQGTGRARRQRRGHDQGADHRRRPQRLRHASPPPTRPPAASTAGCRSRSSRVWPWTPRPPSPRRPICGRSSTGPTC